VVFTAAVSMEEAFTAAVFTAGVSTADLAAAAGAAITAAGIPALAGTGRPIPRTAGGEPSLM
jgi:hypothetical protein